MPTYDIPNEPRTVCILIKGMHKLPSSSYYFSNSRASTLKATMGFVKR